MGTAQFRAFYAGKDKVYYAQEGEDIQFKVTFTLQNEDNSNISIPIEVEAPDIFSAIAKAAPIAKKEYPTAYGKLRSERFLDYVQILVRKSHD